MKNFNLSALSIALMIGGIQLAAVPNYAYAAEADAAAEQAKKDKEEANIEVIEVTGFKGSVIKSLNTKRFSDTVVDAISADDIGGLPDVSIADSLTRLPGVTSVRIDGQSSELNVRGLSGGFVFSTLNGREMVSTSGGRAVQFDIFPSELVSQAQVYKSQKASLIEGGIAATINLETANALDNEEDHSFRASLHGNYNEAAADNNDSDTFGRRLTLSYQGKYLEDTLGVAVGWANMFQPTVSSRFVNYQFDKKENFSQAYNGAPEEIYLSSGFEINERGGEDKRDAFVLALNYEPRDDLRFQVDGFYSKFDSEKWDRGLRVSGINNIAEPGSTLLIDNPLMVGDAIVGGTIYRDPDGSAVAPPFPGASKDLNVQTQADDNTTESEMKAFGFNAEWDISDDLLMSVDISHSEGNETYKDQVMRMAYFDDSSVEYPVIDDNIILSYQLNGLNNPYIEFNQDFTDTAHMMVTSAESYPHIESNSSDAIRVDFAYQLESDIFSSLEFGARASQRDYELSRGRFLYGTTDFKMRNGQYITFGTDADGNTIIVDSFNPFPLNDSNSSVTTIGGDLSGMPSFLTVDNNAILDAWIPNVDRTPVRTWEHDWTMTQGNLVEEDVLAAYLQVNLDTEVFGLPLTGNIGVRYVHSEQYSTGLVSVGTDNGDPIADDLGVINSNWQRKKVGGSYSDVLPSLNLNFGLTDNDQLRFAYAKVMSRPDMPKMANSGNFDWVEDKDVGRYQINLDSSTSPFLRPFYAHQFDLSFEHYFTETDGAFVFAIWYKDIENMVGDGFEDDFDYAAAGIEVPPTPEDKLYDPATGELIDYANGTYTFADNNADAGYMRGVEIGYTQTFNFLPGYLSGLGANVNFSYTDSEIEVESKVPGEDGAPAPIEGLSPRVISATLFYDWEEKFSARISGRYRSAYLSEQIAIGSAQSAYFEEETIISAQMSYNFTENFQAVVSVDNLTDEPNISYFGDTSRTGTIQYFGRTIYFGVNYSM
ncbi:TonB-dependent receptor [Litorilituus sediminis]|uniref:TonB-dependent receptor n=1 Tax=Litorilituus sediminis TaxID=718192 RepID=A0A4P6P736_9GAMM|nr:TonB-dependent receptor [Litorilituus sediminis]QBG36858.1 TonB-dependent receptor [Litorilituus sediminis]